MTMTTEDRGPSKPDEFAALFAQMSELLREMRRAVERDWERAQNAVAMLVRTQTAKGLAPEFFHGKRPYERNAALTTMMEQGLLHHAAFIQKTPAMLAFYRRMFFSLGREPESILEIGVKGGGSAAFWKALFPGATVIGLDIKLRRWLTSSEAAEDGVIYLQGDQTDLPRLEEVARQNGPFDVIIDDGSHVTDHQAGTMRCLLPHVRPEGFYVVEDIHASVKKPGHAADYGDDIWTDFTLAVFQRLRKGPVPAPSPGAKLAGDVSGMIADLVVSTQVLAIRTHGPKAAQAAPGPA